jgi:hypothetical protein
MEETSIPPPMLIAPTASAVNPAPHIPAAAPKIVGARNGRKIEAATAATVTPSIAIVRSPGTTK